MIVPGEFETSFAKITRAIRDLAQGSSNAIGEATLAAASTTQVLDPRCGPNSLVLLSPLDAGAALAGIHVLSTGRGSFTLGHAAGAEGRRVRFEVRKP
ncbi:MULTISPECIES: hypothetical protein [Methylorubrum]|uniref:Uncharacterized protein n=1 Tax=Methylorubrum suomiense TaxID=144191 RepID=A0ABQ4UQR6_9HYPH|nr:MULTISPECIES: hypothetical protein [Methylobacteriaceae]GJE74496.1 hypothetical protein BGCPKDLD_1067 [Methylorubrum suomiense]